MADDSSRKPGVARREKPKPRRPRRPRRRPKKKSGSSKLLSGTVTHLATLVVGIGVGVGTPLLLDLIKGPGERAAAVTRVAVDERVTLREIGIPESTGFTPEQLGRVAGS